MNLFDFPGSPTANPGLDLRHVATIDFDQFMRHLALVNVVVCVSPDDSFVVLPPGDQVMEAVKDRASLMYLTARVANDTQADILAGALMAIDECKLGPGGAGAAELRRLLISVADVPDGMH